jgi:hypothetical protein
MEALTDLNNLTELANRDEPFMAYLKRKLVEWPGCREAPRQAQATRGRSG